jgi:hypothetical protein
MNIKKFTQQNFLYFGIYIDGYRNEKDEIKKRVIMPPKQKQGEKYSLVTQSFISNVYDWKYGVSRKPNGIFIYC